MPSPKCCYSFMWQDYWCPENCECLQPSKEPLNEQEPTSEKSVNLQQLDEPFGIQPNSDELLHSLDELYRAIRQTFLPKN